MYVVNISTRKKTYLILLNRVTKSANVVKQIVPTTPYRYGDFPTKKTRILNYTFES